MIIDIDVADERWAPYQRSADRAARAALAHVGFEEDAVELAIRLSTDGEVQQLNKTYRGKDSATNVLSFEAETPPGALGQLEPRPLGDVILAFETLESEANAQQKSLENHLCHLIVHGVLHLCGHDHDNDETARQMEKLEVTILNELGIADPYLLKEPN